MLRKRRTTITRLPIDHRRALSGVEIVPERERLSWRQRGLVALVIAICYGGVIAISQLLLVHKSLRLDESQTLWQSSHTIPGLLRAVATDVHVPLYHLLMHFWLLYFGSSVEIVRLPSLIFFLLTIPVVYLLARYALSVRWALFTTLLFSFSPFMNWYANETRMYTLLALMTALSQLFFIRIIKYKKGWWGYALTALIGAYTHYFFMFNLATQGIYFLMQRKQFPRHSLKKMLLIAVLVIAELAPWLWYFHSLGSASNTRPMLVRPSTVDFFNAFSQFAYGFQNNHINTILISCWPLLLLVAFFAINQGQKPNKELGNIVTMGFVPVILAFVLSFVVTPFFLSRYLIAAIAPLTVLFVWLLSHYRRKLALLAAAAIMVLMGLTSYQQDFSNSTPVLENYQQAAAMIAGNAQPQDVVAISTPFTIYPFEYFYTGSAQIKTLPLWDRKSAGSIPTFNQATMPNEVKQISANHRNLYLLLSYNQGYEEQIKTYFDTHYARVNARHFSPDLNLYVYRVGYNEVPSLADVSQPAAVTPKR